MDQESCPGKPGGVATSQDRHLLPREDETLSLDLLDNVDLQKLFPAIRGFRCPPGAGGCGRPLAFDVGIQDNGLPAVWARCHPDRRDSRGRPGCGKVWCLNKHEIRRGEAFWAPGKTTGDGEMVGVCIDGRCQSLRMEYERMLVAFKSFPSGAEAHAAEALLKERRAVPDSQEGTLLPVSAQVMLAILKFYREDLPALKRAAYDRLVSPPVSVRSQLSREVAVNSVERWEAQDQAEKAAQRAARAQELAAFDELLAEVGVADPGVDPEMVAILLKAGHGKASG